ncbi:chromogranin-A [Bufo gargarizans]|uniref:chromogranin-A n=1 Tax=Bufo gargarizans TaxID=30331 RepID=UPI001CF146A7|nr:chromogranin-A [Bufo gargarizans]
MSASCRHQLTMLYIGVLTVALCTVQVISFPTSGRDAGDDKVLKCIVDVISGTLTKPNPVPATQDCLETLRGDERIISILRHQNLLKELQELAAQGAKERLQKQKKNDGFGELLSGILDKQSNKPLPSDYKDPLLGNSPERDDVKRQSGEEERKRSSEGTEADESMEELESNEISKREETSEEEKIDNRITDEINDMELPKDNQEDAEEKEPMTKKDEDTEDPEKESHKQDSNETDNEEDDTQREDNSMRIPEDFTKDSTSESENGKETKLDVDTIDCTEENPGKEDDTSSKGLEDSKRWNKMDELAKELRAKKCAPRSSEDDPDQSRKIPPKEPKYDPSSQEAEDRQQWQRSREDSSETEAPILKREEEGSANRKTEDQELESLAAIEAELENVAHKLHDLRRG